MARDQAWWGLWYPRAGQLADELFIRGLIYFVTPLAMALLFGDHGSPGELGRAYLGAFLIGSSIGGCFELCWLVWPRIIRRKPPWSIRIAAHVVTLVVAVAGGTLIATALGRALLGWGDHDMIQLFIQGAVISTVIISILVVSDESSERAREAARREAMHRMTAIRAELAALQARTDPHFLFNSLNTVAALIPDDPMLAETLLLRLSAVFRYALEAGRQTSVALAEEVAAVTAYLEVEALRIGPRLAWRLDREAGLDAVRIPPLVLQPLVENAIHHGAGTRRGKTEIVITVRRRDDELLLAVEDHGDGGAEVREPVSTGAGTALDDLRARLVLAYPDRARLDAGTASPDGWRAEVVVPACGPMEAA